MINQLCPHCDGDGCDKCNDGWKRKRGRPRKGTAVRSVRREIRMEPADAAALDALRKPGETRNDADLRLARAGAKAESSKVYRAARRTGALVPCDACEDCGTTSEPLQGHHEDYSRPLDVVWLCLSCHCSRHGKQAWAAPDGYFDWPAIVFPTNSGSDRVQRSKYRNGLLPSGRKMRQWAKEHGLRFTVDADGLRCERATER
jgi:hypothetical protein